MLSVTTRKAQAEDVEIIADFVHALLDEISGGNAPNRQTVIQNARSVIAQDDVVAFIAFSDEAPIGAIVLNECMAIYAGGRFGEISELYVHPDARSQGVAPHLLDIALAEGRERGWTRLEVGAPGQPQWKRTLEFYLRNDFEEIGPRLCQKL